MIPLLPIITALAQFAPNVIRMVGGSDDSAKTADQVAGIAQAVTGAVSPEDAIAKLQADSAAQMAFAQRMAELEAEQERARLADIADARKRDIAIAQAGRRNVRADVMVALDVAGLVGCLVVLALYRQALPGEAVGIISTIAGIFGACLKDAHQFEFGSSRSSQAKDATIGEVLKGKA